jgi:hypothetical protein
MVLPETKKQLFAAADALSMKKINGLRRLLAKKYLKSKSPMLDQHKIGNTEINYYTQTESFSH